MNALLKKFTTLPLMIAALAAVSLVAGFVSVSALNQPTAVVTNGCDNTCVDITDSGFSKAELAVTTGSTVEFRSADGGSHNLALGRGTDHGAHNEPTIAPPHGDDHHAEAASHDDHDKQAHDHLNPDFTILVVVYDPAA